MVPPPPPLPNGETYIPPPTLAKPVENKGDDGNEADDEMQVGTYPPRKEEIKEEKVIMGPV